MHIHVWLRDAAGKIVVESMILKANPTWLGNTVAGPVDVDVAAGLDWDLAESFLVAAKAAGLHLARITLE